MVESVAVADLHAVHFVLDRRSNDETLIVNFFLDHFGDGSVRSGAAHDFQATEFIVPEYHIQCTFHIGSLEDRQVDHIVDTLLKGDRVFDPASFRVSASDSYIEADGEECECDGNFLNVFHVVQNLNVLCQRYPIGKPRAKNSFD